MGIASNQILDFAKAIDLVKKAQRIVLSTHIMPDGDGLGAEIALFSFLQGIGKDVYINNPDSVPGRYRFLDPKNNIGVLKPIKNADLVIVVDTGDYRRLGALWPKIVEGAKQVIFFDHHPRLPDEHINPATLSKNIDIFELLDVHSSSIGEMLYRFFHAYHQAVSSLAVPFRFDPAMALGLYVSIITDTNSFRYARTTALSHRIAAELIDFGIQPEEIYQNIFSTKTADHLKLIGSVLSKVSVELNERVAFVEIPLDLRKKYGATADDTQSIVNFLLLLKSPEILVLMREEDNGSTKVSLKSKGKVIVNDLASSFGGGGHNYAAGFVSNDSMEVVRMDLLKKLSTLLAT